MKLYPLKFKEIYKNYIWGGEGFERLGKIVPNNFAAESWEIACHKDGMSVVANGYLRGRKLNELISELKYDLVGNRVALSKDTFPLLVKLINAKDRLSVQVHPDDAYAYSHEGEQGKNEAWVILYAQDNAELIVGLKQGITKEEFKTAIENSEIISCLNRIKVQAGDIINIPEGLVHAIGKGIMLAEIQQNSNTTYRIFDYNRLDDEGNLRALHVDKAFSIIDFPLKKDDKKALGISMKINENSTRKIAIANKYFSLETYDIRGEIKQIANGETFLIYIITEGEGSIKHNGNITKVSKGDTYLIPASLNVFSIDGNMKLIKSYVPDLAKDILDPLLEMGYKKDEIFSRIAGLKEHLVQDDK